MKLINIIILTMLCSCASTKEKLSRVGESPAFSNIEVPNSYDVTDDIDDSKKLASLEYTRRTGGLWRPGDNSFLKDNRSWNIGDIIKITVVIKDSAKMDNSSQHSRSGTETMGLSNLFGNEKKVATSLSSKGVAANLLGLNGDRKHNGTGNISRKEDVQAEVAATVVQILKNGNLVLQGRQEVRVNYELREVTVAGIARPKDIKMDNSISSNQIAEARISYGGKGSISDVQQPRVGHQIIDILSPF